tara:strand:- start:898 stop:1182 length:285 start_codon:yes stop_codon:yes gene_type:complete
MFSKFDMIKITLNKTLAIPSIPFSFLIPIVIGTKIQRGREIILVENQKYKLLPSKIKITTNGFNILLILSTTAFSIQRNHLFLRHAKKDKARDF